MLLGIEIGGTKTQLGVSHSADGPLEELVRLDVDRELGAAGILEQIEYQTGLLKERHTIERLGIGFGGPVDRVQGRVIKSHHVAGWDDFALRDWCVQNLGHAATVANDADVAGLAEAHLGAGKGCDPVLYITVGTGIGGGLIRAGKIAQGHGPTSSEIGHLRPGLRSERPDQILESYASGWGIAAAAQACLTEPVAHDLHTLRGDQPPAEPEDVRQRLIEAEEENERWAADLRQVCGGNISELTAELVGAAAAAGNPLARRVLERAWQALGLAIAQAITLISPEVVVIGGGVSLLGEEHFFRPLAEEVARYVFPPLEETYQIVPAALGEEVVVRGALVLASEAGAEPL